MKRSFFEQCVEEFQKKHNGDIARPWTGPDTDLIRLRISLIEEEMAEFKEAVAQNDGEQIMKELCDLLYVVIGFGVVFNLPLVEAFTKVHEANMLKVTGVLKYNDQGKLLKGENYVPPDMSCFKKIFGRSDEKN